MQRRPILFHVYAVSIDRIHGKCGSKKKLLPIKQWAFIEGVWPVWLVQDTSGLETLGKLPPDLSRCLGWCHQVSRRPKFSHILRSNLRNFDLSSIFLAVSILKHQSYSGSIKPMLVHLYRKNKEVDEWWINESEEIRENMFSKEVLAQVRTSQHPHYRQEGDWRN